MKHLTQKAAPNEEIRQMLKLINKIKRSQNKLWDVVKKQEENGNNK